jgi:hypothetical protein
MSSAGVSCGGRAWLLPVGAALWDGTRFGSGGLKGGKDLTTKTHSARAAPQETKTVHGACKTRDGGCSIVAHLDTGHPLLWLLRVRCRVFFCCVVGDTCLPGVRTLPFIPKYFQIWISGGVESAPSHRSNRPWLPLAPSCSLLLKTTWPAPGPRPLDISMYLEDIHVADDLAGSKATPARSSAEGPARGWTSVPHFHGLLA